MKIAVFGAYGFLGKQLIDQLLTNKDNQIIAVSRSSRPAFWPASAKSQVQAIVGDVRDKAFVSDVLRQVEVAYYFVHFMGHRDQDMYQQEAAAAETFGQAARQAKLGRLIYMGGLTDKQDRQLSAHLRSRQRTGEILRATAPRVIEFQASMIIGQGSVAFDIIRNLVAKLPIVLLPRSSRSLTQPIAVQQAVEYLVAASQLPLLESSQIFEIGGPEVLSYQTLYRKYLQFSGKRQIVIEAPFVSSKLEAHFLNLFIPKVHAQIGGEIMASLTTQMVVQDNQAQAVFPDIKPISLLQAFQAADKR